MRFCARPRHVVLLLLVVVALGGLVSRVEASDGMRGNKCVVAADEVIAEDFYFFCRVLRVRGTIDGDLIGAAVEITIDTSAVVTGDLWVGAAKLDIKGTVGDDMHFAGITTSIAGSAQFPDDRTDLVAVAINTEIRSAAMLPGDLLVYGYQATVDGTINGDIDFQGEALIINGSVGGRIDASVGDPSRRNDISSIPVYDLEFSNPGIHLATSASVGEDLSYESVARSSIPTGVVGGRVRFEQIATAPDITQVAEPNEAVEIVSRYITKSLRDTVTLLIIGGVAVGLYSNVIRQPAQHVRRRTVSSVGWGLVTFMFSIPTAIVVTLLGLLVMVVLYTLALNALTFMVGLGLLVISTGLVGGFYFLMFFMGRVVVSYAGGHLLYRRVLRLPEEGNLRQIVITLVTGALAFAFITNVPVPALSLVIQLMTALAGAGAVIMYIRDVLYTSNLFTPRVTVPDEIPVQHAPPPLDVPVPRPIAPPTRSQAAAPPPAPGMDNLPPGFTGFDDDW